MTTFDVAVFVDAHHLMGVPDRDAKSTQLMSRIDSATSYLALAGKASHRVMVADCADTRIQSFLADYGQNAGFRIRHCADRALVPHVLAAEAFEAVHLNPALRSVVLVGSPAFTAPLVDVLHRIGRSVLTLTTEETAPGGATDSVVALPLDTAVVASMIAETLEELESTSGTSDVAVRDLERALRDGHPEFAPGLYGCRTLVLLLERLNGRSVLLNADHSRVERVRRAGESRRPPVTAPDVRPAAPVIPAARPGSSLEETLQRIAREVGEHAGDSAPELEAAVDLLVTAVVHEFGSSSVMARGISVSPHLRKAFRVTVPGYTKERTQVGFVELCRGAATRSDTWTVAAHDDKSTDIRVFCGVPAAGYTALDPVPAPQEAAPEPDLPPEDAGSLMDLVPVSLGRHAASGDDGASGEQVAERVARAHPVSYQLLTRRPRPSEGPTPVPHPAAPPRGDGLPGGAPSHGYLPELPCPCGSRRRYDACHGS